MLHTNGAMHAWTLTGPGFGAVEKHTIWCCKKFQPLISKWTVQI